MYVIVKSVENNGVTYFSMLASNGIFVDDNLVKAIIFPTSTIAIKQQEILSALKPDETFMVKEIVLQDIQNN